MGKIYISTCLSCKNAYKVKFQGLKQIDFQDTGSLFDSG